MKRFTLNAYKAVCLMQTDSIKITESQSDKNLPFLKA